MPYKKILLVETDGVNDTLAIERAHEVHTITGAKITVVKVVEDLNKLIKLSKKNVSDYGSIKQIITADLQRKVKSVYRNAMDKYVSYKLLEGTPFLAIIREVLRENYDLLIISASGQLAVDAGLFGSINYHLFRKCPCPVWVVKPRKRKTCKNILVAVDVDPEDEVKVELNNKLMNTAIMLASRFEAKLTIFHSWQLYGEDTFKNSPFLKVKEKDIKIMLEEEKLLRVKNFEAFLDLYNFDDIAIKTLLKKGKASKLIPEIVKADKIDLVVMGTVCRVGVAGFFIGNTAEEILQKISCSVLTIKPDGFDTPVKI